MYCSKCGNELLNAESVCPNCGESTNTAVNQQPNLQGDRIPVAPNGTEQKSKLAAGLLGVLLGAFGAHNFYLGYTGKAIAQLLITCLTCGIGAIVSGIWGLIEGILILTGSTNTDAKGVPLKD